MAKRGRSVRSGGIAQRHRRKTSSPLAAAVWAGVAAGVVSTAAQLALWALFTDALPGILLRDTRLAAAIVLGPDVLPSPAGGFDLFVLFVATVVHFALSIAYGLALAALIRGAGALPPLLVGALFGATLFALNMYGFTLAFPWFDVARDWITFAAHLVFGISAAAVYQALRTPRTTPPRPR